MQTRELETVNWSYDEGTGIGRIVLNRPEAHNALSEQLKNDIVEGFSMFDDIDDEGEGVNVRTVILEGAGDKAFSAGADITEFDERNPGIFDPTKAWDTAEEFPAPVIAKIDGYCFGGGLELALACDFRIASKRSEVGLTEVNIGLIPGGGGTQRLAEIVGPSRAKELCITGEHVPAEEAAEDGIVNYVYPAEELDDEVHDFAVQIAQKAPLAVRAVKDVINMSQEMQLEEGRMYEHRACLNLFQTEDQKEGARAFAEKRDPKWSGE